MRSHLQHFSGQTGTEECEKSAWQAEGLWYWLCNMFSLSKWNEPVSEDPISSPHTGTKWETGDATVHWRHVAVNDLCYGINVPLALDRSVLAAVMFSSPVWSTESSYQDLFSQYLPRMLSRMEKHRSYPACKVGWPFQCTHSARKFLTKHKPGTIPSRKSTHYSNDPVCSWGIWEPQMFTFPHSIASALENCPGLV